MVLLFVVEHGRIRWDDCHKGAPLPETTPRQGNNIQGTIFAYSGAHPCIMIALQFLLRFAGGYILILHAGGEQAEHTEQRLIVHHKGHPMVTVGFSNVAKLHI